MSSRTASPATPRRATRTDVARRAGTSTAVVSYVINDGPRGVAPETAERVREAICELNYRPNAVARSLRLQRTHALGLIVPDLANPFFAEIASAIERNAAEHGEALLLGNSLDSEERQTQNLRTFIDYRVDGLIVVPVIASSGSLAAMSDVDIPLVILDRPVAASGAPIVMPDNAGGARAATEHLLQHGYRTVGCIAGPGSLPTAEERLRGWRDAVESARIPEGERFLARSEFDRDDGYRAAMQMLSAPVRPRALFVSSDEQAFGVLRACARLQLRIPDDIAIVSFDGLHHSQSTVPRLTTMRQPFEELGELAVALVHETPPTRVVDRFPMRLPVTLQAGGSCGCADTAEDDF